MRAGDSLASIAREIATHRGQAFSWQELSSFNFRTSVPAEINWCLHRFVGCRDSEGANYIFTNRDRPGLIYIPPVRTPVPDPPPPRPNPANRPVARPARQHSQSGCQTTICRSCPRIAEYIAAVEKVERMYPHLAATPAAMVTSLRKLWSNGTYNSFQWDRMLEDANTDPFPLTADRVGTECFSPFEMWLLGEIDCLRTPQHGCTDFGHVLTGVDATNFPDASDWAVRELDTPTKVIAGCTWSGDLGSVYRAVGDSTPSQARFDELWAAFASVEDLLGDVDGVVLGARFDSSRPFSAQLADYYAQSRTQANIFTTFPTVHAMTTDHIKEMTWAWIDAREVGTPTRTATLLDRVAARFEQFVQDGQAGQIRNRCESVRTQARQRPSVVASCIDPTDAGVPLPAGVPSDAGPPPDAMDAGVR